MQRIRKAVPVILLMLWDIVSAGLSVYAAFALCYWIDSGVPDYYTNNQFLYMIGVALVVVFFNAVFGNYSSVWRSFGINEVYRLLPAVVMDIAVFFLVDAWARSYVERYYPGGSSRLPAVCYVILALFILFCAVASRASVRFCNSAKGRMKGMFASDAAPVIIYGAGEAGSYLSSKLQTHPEDNLRPVAFIDDDPLLKNKKINSLRVLGGLDFLAGAIDRFGAKQVIVAIPTASKEMLSSVLDICREKGCNMRRFGTIDEGDVSKMQLGEINLEDLLRRDRVTLNMRVVRDFVKGKTVMVTGGAGSIGSEICRQVLSFGCKKLVVFDIHENGLFYIDNELKERYKNGEFEVRLGSIRDRARLEEVFTEFEPQLVFHAAAHKHVPMMEINPAEAIKNNVLGTINTAQTAIHHKVEKFILISTDKAVNPTNIMGASKRITELVIQMMDTISPDTDFAAVRFGNVLGSNGSVVPFFRKQIAEGGPVTVTHPDMRRYFMTIPEAVQLVLEAGAMASGGEIFVLDMGQPVKISDLARDLIRLSGFKPDVDIKIVYTGLRPGEKLLEEISMADEDVDRTANNKIAVMKPIDTDYHMLAKTIKQLEGTLHEGDLPGMFALVKELVPTFTHKSI